MTSLIAKQVGRKVAGGALSNALGSNIEDPYFEQVPVLDKKGNPLLDRNGQVKTKKRRKGLPAGISENDEKILTKVKKSAYRLDLSLFSCCGIRFGWSSVIGLVPFAGDAAECMLAWRLVRMAQKIDGGLPANLQMQMFINIMIDFAIGFVPFIGDLADAVYKCNTKNAAILEKYLRKQGAKNLQAQGQPTPDIDAPVTFDLEEMEHKNDLPPPSYDSTNATPVMNQSAGASSQQPLGNTRQAKQGGSRWFGGKSKGRDVESGQGDVITQAPVHQSTQPGSSRV